MHSPSKPSFKPVEAVTRALSVLRVVSEQKQATVASIHRHTGLDKATIVRMLETLHHAGYVTKDLERAVYSVTARTLLLSQGYDKSRWMASIAEPSLGTFRNAIGWPSDIALFDSDAMVVVQTSRGNGPLSFNRQPGFRSPMLVTSIGLAYMAFCQEHELQQIIERLVAIPGEWNELAHRPEALKKQLEQVREDGFAVMDSAYSTQVFGNSVWALGVPLMHAGELFGAMNVMLLKNAVTLDEARKKLLAPLQATAQEIAWNLATSQQS